MSIPSLNLQKKLVVKLSKQHKTHFGVVTVVTSPIQKVTYGKLHILMTGNLTKMAVLSLYKMHNNGMNTDPRKPALRTHTF